jgi:uncharacterized protein (UPF0276 family)
MKKDGTAVVEEEATGVVAEQIQKIDEMLERFIGIRDMELSTTMHNLCKTAKEPEVFAGLLDKDLGDFVFPDDFVLDVRRAFFSFLFFDHSHSLLCMRLLLM